MWGDRATAQIQNIPAGRFPGCVADRYKSRSLIVLPAARGCLCAGAGWPVVLWPGAGGALDGLPAARVEAGRDAVVGASE